MYSPSGTWLPQVLHATSSSRIGIATVIRCLACQKTAADARVVAVVWWNRKNGKLPMTITQKASFSEHSRGCGLHDEHRLF
ncbi:unnamed protein product [Ectocarpus sp. 13 AM-2016]